MPQNQKKNNVEHSLLKLDVKLIHVDAFIYQGWKQ